ncbi:hypothetical protein [uncultured Akkermansia sp.]|uniref:hypothetical protein n=1 Tax=uncultured Akkermansia sp. TaxID=512294 RepID=UPI00262860A7|nr:hypothetical protein [uncultured Akkermansia sp.]
MKRIIKIKEKNIDKESAIITIKIIVFSIVSFVIMIFGIFFLVGKLNNFRSLPENYRGNTLEYHHEHLNQEGFSYFRKGETQGVPEYLVKDFYIYRKKVLLGFYHYIMLSKKKNGLKIDSGSQYLSTPFNKLIFSYYKNFVPKERPPIVNREDIQ